MSKTDLEELSKQELIQLILVLQDEIEALKLKFEKNQKPPTSSKNSSQPPSRDHKVSLPKDRRRHRHGPPKGYEKHERKFVAQPDKIVELRVKSCGKCHTDLSQKAGKLFEVTQITELPPASAQVIEVRQYATTCSECGTSQIEEPPAGYEMNRRFGSRLQRLVGRSRA